MSIQNNDKIAEFRRKLCDLVLEYNVEVETNTGYYGDVEGVEFCVDGKRAVECTPYGYWSFDDDATRSLDDIRSALANNMVSRDGA